MCLRLLKVEFCAPTAERQDDGGDPITSIRKDRELALGGAGTCIEARDA